MSGMKSTNRVVVWCLSATLVVALALPVLAGARDQKPPTPPKPQAAPASPSAESMARLEARLASMEARLAQLTETLERMERRMHSRPMALPEPPRPPRPDALPYQEMQRYAEAWRDRWQTWEEDARDRYEELEKDLKQHADAWRDWQREIERHWHGETDPRPETPPAREYQAVNQYRLSDRQADLLYEQLAPSYVTVVVSRQGNRVTVRGTKAEIDALDAAMELLNWTRRGALFEEMIQGERVRKLYTSREEHINTLYAMLAPNDVRVVISRRDADTVSILGTEAEHDVLKSMIDVFAW